MTARPTTELPAGHPSLGPARLSSGPSVFAVECTTAQLCWQSLGEAGRTQPRAGADARTPVTATDAATGRVVGTGSTDGGPGTIELQGLVPGAPQAVRLDVAGRPAGGVTLTTMEPLGRELSRFATLSDIHLGLDVFGFRGTMVEAVTPEWRRERETTRVDLPISVRAARGAIDELTGWGAQHLFIKGDLVDRSTPATWAMAGRLLARTRLPTTVMTGNHEHNRCGIVPPHEGAAAVGIDAVRGVRRVDLPGLSVLCIDTIRPGAHGGTVRAEVTEAALAALEGVANPVVVLTHHPIERFNQAWSHPPGIPHREGRDLVATLSRHCELLLVSSGHTHAHRRRTVAGVTTTEVGSPKDFPGVWGGYVVYEQGVCQVVRRVTSPQVRDWLSFTRRAAGGVWGRWSPGRLGNRSLQVRRG
ncbi:MAG: metallophosphoesterase [Microthrixaceae bacterium]|nr:metallophosphoesterase [Microthrixaceae bacterium]